MTEPLNADVLQRELVEATQARIMAEGDRDRRAQDLVNAEAHVAATQARCKDVEARFKEAQQQAQAEAGVKAPAEAVPSTQAVKPNAPATPEAPAL